MFKYMQMNNLLNYTDEELVAKLCPVPVTPKAWSFTGQELRSAIQGERLLNVSIDLSNECNLNCPYCYTTPANSSERTKSVGNLTFEDYKEIILQLKEVGTRTVNIIGEGEPTMYRYFDQLVAFIAEQGMKILVTTNGILLANRDKRIDLLNETGATIVIKVNSLIPNMQDKLVGRKGYAKLREKALKKLMEKGFNAEVPTRLAVNTLLIKSIFQEFEDIFLFCRNNNIAFIASVYMPTGRTTDIEFHGHEALARDMQDQFNLYTPMTQEEIDSLLNNIIEYDSNYNISRAIRPAYISGIACTQLLGVQIDNKGKVWCCPTRKIMDDNDFMVSQSLAENTDNLLSLWNNDAFLKKMRNRYDGSCIFKQSHQKY